MTNFVQFKGYLEKLIVENMTCSLFFNKNSCLTNLLPKIVLIPIFGHTCFGKKMSVAIKRAPDGLGPPKQIKNLVHWEKILGQPLSRDHVLSNTWSA